MSVEYVEFNSMELVLRASTQAMTALCVRQ